MRQEDPRTQHTDPGPAVPGPAVMQQTVGYPPPPPPLPPSAGYRARPRRGILSHLAVAVLAAAVTAGVTVAVDHPAASTSTAGQPPLPGASVVPGPAPASGASPGGAADEQTVVNKVEPGLVTITTTQQYDSQGGAGTGMIISPSGLVLTNNHVIAGATKITATVPVTGRSYPARVIGYDKTGDIALIQLQGAAGLRTVPIGNSATVRAGDTVVALGNADGQGTLVDGTICGSPAAAAGLTGGSVITAVSGKPVGSPVSLSSILATFRPGSKITLTWVSPSGRHITSNLQLIAGPPQ
jgi:S1-C subfamily serine protease